jgi:hypothetical protein
LAAAAVTLDHARHRLDRLLTVAAVRRRWSAREHDEAAALVRTIYATGLLRRTRLSHETVDEILRRLRAIHADRAGLLESPLDWAERLSDLALMVEDAVNSEPEVEPDVEP